MLHTENSWILSYRSNNRKWSLGKIEGIMFLLLFSVTVFHCSDGCILWHTHLIHLKLSRILLFVFMHVIPGDNNLWGKLSFLPLVLNLLLPNINVWLLIFASLFMTLYNYVKSMISSDIYILDVIDFI